MQRFIFTSKGIGLRVHCKKIWGVSGHFPFCTHLVEENVYKTGICPGRVFCVLTVDPSYLYRCSTPIDCWTKIKKWKKKSCMPTGPAYPCSESELVRHSGFSSNQQNFNAESEVRHFLNISDWERKLALHRTEPSLCFSLNWKAKQRRVPFQNILFTILKTSY